MGGPSEQAGPARARPAGGPAEEPEQVLQGVVERVTFRSPDTGYTVLALTPEAGHAPAAGLFAALGGRAAAVGRAPEAVEGDRLRLRGRWEEHPQHGRRFAFDSWEPLVPLGREGLERYLASSRFPGIGPTLAQRIVTHLGPAALGRIAHEAGALAGVRGLRPALAAELAARVREELGHQELLAFLLGLGLNAGQVEAAARALGPGAERVLRADPYVLARRVPGVGFLTADAVAVRLGLDPASRERRAAALLHALEHAGAEGHTLQRASQLFALARGLLREEIDDAALADALLALDAAGEVALERGLAADAGDPLVYPSALFTCETRLAANLLALADAGPVPALAGPAELEAAARAAGLALHPDQARAVLGLLAAPVALLTGGPGVGKTSIVRLVCALAERAGRSVLLASPTGRAAKRLAEASGREASTIHRLLGFEPRGGGFQHDAANPLRADVVVVDEISMLDLALAHHLVKAVQPPTRLLLVGDPDQLPSVAPGNVLADLLESGRFPVHRLTRVFRQQKDGLIVHNAHRILEGRLPELPRAPDADGAPGDFFFFGAEGEEECAARLVEVATRRIPARFGLDWARDVQVLAPMYRGPCGVDALNERLRAELPAGGRELTWSGRAWREGERVIQTRNDYERGVFNGDMGRIVHVAPDGKRVRVRFPERELDYAPTALRDLQRAFAVTVHRAQGAEFPAVVMPLVMQHAMMLRRHLLYTAVTRAQRLLVLVGSRRALELAVAQAERGGRESALCERLRRGPERDRGSPARAAEPR